MTAYQCVRCSQYWSGSAGVRERFSVITRWCPNCIAGMPVMACLASAPATGTLLRVVTA